MANFVDEFMKNYGPEVTKQMSSTFNVDRGTVQKLLPKLAPLILSGLKKQKDERGGNDRVDHILNKYGDQSVLNSIRDLVSAKATDTSTDARLGGLLGEGGLTAASVLGKQMKIDPSVVMKMIPALAPLILGALSRKRDAGNAGIGGIGSLLDANGDGSILDDVSGFLLKGGTGKSVNKGVLGSILGGLFRSK